jgi:signal peptidase I
MGAGEAAAPLPAPAAGPRAAPWWQRLLIGRRPRRTLVRLLVVAAVAFVVFRFLLLPMRIEGESMAPTYRTGGFNFINTLSYVFRSPRRGDIVGIEMAGRRIMFMKRIVGMPGERFDIQRGIVYIDGRPLDEPYVTRRHPWEVEEHVLGADEYLVIGDNRAVPQRMHRFGIVKRKHIVGKVLY